MIDNPADQFNKQLDEALSHGVGPKAARFALACLGAVPGIGGAITGIASTWSEQEQAQFNHIFQAWLKLQEDEIREIGVTIFEVMARLDQNDEEIRKRVESPEYLRLVKSAFVTGPRPKAKKNGASFATCLATLPLPRFAVTK